MNRITLHDLRKNIPQSDNYDKGLLFEEYIKQLFNQESFQLKRWRRSFKVPEDTYIGDMSGPDLELMFKGRNSKPLLLNANTNPDFMMG